MTDRSERFTLPLMAVALVALPFCLSALGLTLTSATDVVVFAVACMGLNILVGQTGLVSFGHGAFFGIGAYAAAIGQRTFFPGTLLPSILFALAVVAGAALLLGLLILRRRGVYFSLLTLALSALSFTVAFRWTALTGGESGYGGVERTRFLGLDLDAAWTWYGLVAVAGTDRQYSADTTRQPGLGADQQRVCADPAQRAGAVPARIRQLLRCTRLR